MNESLSGLLSTVTRYLVLIQALLLTLLFWNLTSEYFDTPKFLSLMVVTGVLLIIWVARSVIEGKFSLTRTPLDIPLLLMLVILGVSVFFSASKSVSIIGNLPRIHGGLSSFVVYILFYFALVSTIRAVATVKQLIYLLVFSGIVLSGLAILSYQGIHLLGIDYTKFVNFTPTGNSFNTSAILALLLPFPIIAILRATPAETQEINRQPFLSNLTAYLGVKLPLALISALFAGVIVLIGTTATHVAGVAALALVILSTPQATVRKNLLFVVLPVVVAGTIALLSFVKIDSLPTNLYAQAQAFPQEIQLPPVTSWKVSVSAFRDAPFWGSGPATYLSDFTNYKPIEFNQTKHWNVRFDSAFNEYLGFLATLGAPGLIALLLLTVIALSLAVRGLRSDQSVIGVGLSVSVLVFFIILAMHSSTLVLWGLGMMILASFMVVHKSVTEQLHLGIAAAKGLGSQLNLSFEALPEILLVIILVGLGATSYFGGKLVLADYHHRQALNQVATGNGVAVFNELQSAVALNPSADIYRTDLAQTSFALANAIASSKAPTEASPGGSLTDVDRQNIQTLLQLAIAQGRTATELNPANPINWEILGSIYRQISGVAQNALLFALDSYGRAIQADPLNPQLRLTVGGIYYAVNNQDLAIRFFSDAVNLKPDWPNGYYNLSVALKQKGDLKGAIAAAERTVALLEPSSADYQPASDYLAQLKKEAAEATKTPPAAKSSDSALEKSGLPQVIDLPKPEKIATPEAIKKEEEK